MSPLPTSQKEAIVIMANKSKHFYQPKRQRLISHHLHHYNHHQQLLQSCSQQVYFQHQQSVLFLHMIITADCCLLHWLHKNPRRAVGLVVLWIPACNSTLGTQNCHIRIKQLDILSITHVVTSTFVSQQCKEMKQIFSSCPPSSYKRSHKSWKAVYDQL